MIRYIRPNPPSDFAAASAAALSALEAHVHTCGGTLGKEKLPFDGEFWRNHTPAFMRAQHSKCGYCEQSISNRTRDLEHYAPKAAVTRLPSDGVRAEGEGGKAVGSAPQLVCRPGYWWLAYSWDNWLVACKDCNQTWKLNLFPLEGDPDAGDPALVLHEAAPLLLHPLEEPDPEEHLQFGPGGSIQPRENSKRGCATIRTCGLDRTSLCESRMATMANASMHITLVREARKEQAPDTIGLLLAKLMDDSRPRVQFAGVTRSLVRDQLDGTSRLEMAEAATALCRLARKECVANQLAGWSGALDALRSLGMDHVPFHDVVRKVIRRHLGFDWERITSAPAPAGP